MKDSRIVIRRNGIELPARDIEPGEFRRRWGIPLDTKLVLFLGRLISKKSPDLLLEAFAQWRQNAPLGPDAVLVMAAPEKMMASCRAFGL